MRHEDHRGWPGSGIVRLVARELPSRNPWAQEPYVTTLDESQRAVFNRFAYTTLRISGAGLAAQTTFAIRLALLYRLRDRDGKIIGPSHGGYPYASTPWGPVRSFRRVPSYVEPNPDEDACLPFGCTGRCEGERWLARFDDDERDAIEAELDRRQQVAEIAMLADAPRDRDMAITAAELRKRLGLAPKGR